MAFIDRILPVPVSGGFRMTDYWVWCGSVIQGEDQRYHMFAARWPKELPFFDGYKTHSEVVRAVSDTPEGPYVYQEQVLFIVQAFAGYSLGQADIFRKAMGKKIPQVMREQKRDSIAGAKEKG
mgnify:CR=1 FL=1